jgi:hypothetical protein
MNISSIERIFAENTSLSIAIVSTRTITSKIGYLTLDIRKIFLLEELA